MVGRTHIVLSVLCWALFQVAQARKLEVRPAGSGGGLIRPTLLPQLPQPPTDVNTTGNFGIFEPIIAPSAEISEGLYEGDIILTQEQKRLLRQRKATDPALYWPKDSTGTVTVGYRFGDSIINRAQVKVALTHWETNTCVRFKEVASNVRYAHLNFINDAFSCSSYVGWIKTMTGGQPIKLASGCLRENGPAVHEIGHALGFHHEQSRSDRDNYVRIMTNNIQAGSEHNFAKPFTHNHAIPYDYSSIMHYGPNYFTKNGQNTILALNPRAQPLMGNRIGLSFMDKLMANKMYGCLGKWLKQCSQRTNPCKNMGYTGPTCRCVCPEGTSGSRCEVFRDSYTNALIKLETPYSETITSRRTISTPGYPTPIQTRTKFVKVLVAPYGYKLKLTFQDFEVYGRYTDGTCAVDALSVRTQDALGTEKTYCGKEIAPRTVFISGGNTIVLEYYNYNYVTSGMVSPFRGFRATVDHIRATG